MKYRTEFDSIGKIKVPGDKYWGASTERSKKARETRLARNQISNLEMLFESELASHTILNIVIKADTHGSLEAIIGSIKNLENEEVRINIVHEGVGAINANDINLALTTDSFVTGPGGAFLLRP